MQIKNFLSVIVFFAVFCAHKLIYSGNTCSGMSADVCQKDVVEEKKEEPDVLAAKEWKEAFDAAVAKGDRKLLAALICWRITGCDVEMRDKDGRTALMHAATSGNTETVRNLIEAKANVNARDKEGFFPLAFSVLRGKTATTQFLLEKRANIDARSNDGTTALMGAVVGGHVDTVILLLESKADVEARHKSGLSALGLALDRKDLDTARLLVERKAEQNRAPENEAERIVVELTHV